MRQLVAIAALNVLAACSGGDNADRQKAEVSLSQTDDDSVGSALDIAAVEAGLIPSKDDIDLSGRFERRSDLGTDKFCATGTGPNYNIGALAVFGPESKCEARGVAKREGETIRISFTGRKDCQFDAKFDGIELIIPGSLPEDCASYCTDRASFSGVSFFFVEAGDQAARSASGRKFDRLCEK